MTGFMLIFWMKWLGIRGVTAALIAISTLGVSACHRNNVTNVPLGQAPDGSKDGERADGRPRWKSVRTIMVGDVWATSPDGKYVATIAESRLRVTTALAGPVLHHVAIPIVANDVIVTKTTVVCYKSLDPAATSVAVLDIKTGQWTRIDAKASIWSVIADDSGDGIWMACGDHTVRHYPKLDASATGVSKILLSGFGGTLSSDSGGCIVTEVLPAGITAISNATKMRWHIDEENPKRVSRVIANGSAALYLDSIERTQPNNHTITSISAATGAPIWEVQHSGKRVNAVADKQSGMLAVSVGTPEARVTSKLYAYHRNGTVIMDGRGSGYFSPMLVGVTESGHRITVIDGQRGLTTLSDSGSTLARRMPLPEFASDFIVEKFSRLSTDDRFLFIQTATNKVMVMEALHGE